MLRSLLVAAGACVVASGAFGQRALDRSRIFPITAPVQDAGTLNWMSKTWTPPGAATPLNSGKVTVYNNTCTWAGGAYYAPLEACEDIWDQGRIPSSPDGPRGTKGATDDNAICAFEFSYCTTAITGTVDIKIGLYANHNCCYWMKPAAGSPPTPPPISTTATCYFDFGASAGFPLPGSVSTTTLACWLVRVGFANAPCCLLSDGDGDWDNDFCSDQFRWTFQHENATTPGLPNGPIVSGEPAASPIGGCTYRIPCGTDPIYGNPCGHGLDTLDEDWINVDGVRPLDTASGKCLDGVAPVGGTDCYFFGGYPSNPFASLWLKLDSSGDCDGCTGDVFSYCTSKTNSLGCLPTIHASGIPSEGRIIAPFNLFTNQALPGKAGLLFFGINGPNGAIFQGGHLCVLPPTKRTPLQTSAATGAPPCTGVFSFDFNAYIRSGKCAELNYGRRVWAQYWTRDAGVASGTSLTNGIAFTICL